MEISKVELLTAFMRNGVRGQTWSEGVYAVALYSIYGCARYHMAKNTNKIVHAEDKALDYLDALLEYRILDCQRVKLFISASPCQRCSLKIVDFLNAARERHDFNLRIEIVFSAFYKVRRPSCERHQSCRARDQLPSAEDHTVQVHGLKTLHSTPGVVLRTFNEADWQQLQTTLNIHDIHVRGRQQEDDMLRKDFQHIMGIQESTRNIMALRPILSEESETAVRFPLEGLHPGQVVGQHDRDERTAPILLLMLGIFMCIYSCWAIIAS